MPNGRHADYIVGRLIFPATILPCNHVKWGRTPLAEDILISSVRGGGAELGRC